MVGECSVTMTTIDVISMSGRDYLDVNDDDTDSHWYAGWFVWREVHSTRPAWHQKRHRLRHSMLQMLHIRLPTY